jgi:FAD synthase
MRFSARVVSGSGEAKKQNVPTINLHVEDVPGELEHGIYACRVLSGLPAVMHYGPRFMHKLPVSCEVHLLDTTVSQPPASLSIEVVKRIRDVADFSSTDALKEAIQNDLEAARAILNA